MCECAFDLALEGISRIRKCSPEGRLAMTLDVFDLNAGLNRVKNNPSSSSSSSSTSTSTSTSNNVQDINSPSNKTNNNDKNKTNNKDKEGEVGKEKEIITNDSNSSSSSNNNGNYGNKKTVDGSGVGVEKGRERGRERGSATRGPVTIRRGKEHVDQYIQATYLLDEGKCSSIQLVMLSHTRIMLYDLILPSLVSPYLTYLNLPYHTLPYLTLPHLT